MVWANAGQKASKQNIGDKTDNPKHDSEIIISFYNKWIVNTMFNQLFHLKLISLPKNMKETQFYWRNCVKIESDKPFAISQTYKHAT